MLEKLTVIVGEMEAGNISLKMENMGQGIYTWFFENRVSKDKGSFN